VLIRDFSTRIMRGDRIGLIGPNGAGKSTLLKLVLGEILPDSGTVRQGTQLAIAYFDQLRETLDPDATLAETISPGAEFVEIGATRKHVMTYLADFMFPPERSRSPVRSLSGGERNRLLLARLFAQPANVLVLDEPTNDLDIETLELLESLLQEYSGTLFLVSHDRAFLDNVVTQTIAFEGGGVLREYAGGYSDWEAYQRARADERADDERATRIVSERASTTTSGSEVTKPGATRTPPSSARALSFREQRELEAIPATIETLEREIERLRTTLADPLLYRDRPDEIGKLHATLAEHEAKLVSAYARWEALEARALPS
jgi:ATP-binding cassette subfamily F protein uup